jgi:hypothetical protein
MAKAIANRVAKAGYVVEVAGPDTAKVRALPD